MGSLPSLSSLGNIFSNAGKTFSGGAQAGQPPAISPVSTPDQPNTAQQSLLTNPASTAPGTLGGGGGAGSQPQSSGAPSFTGGPTPGQEQQYPEQYPVTPETIGNRLPGGNIMSYGTHAGPMPEATRTGPTDVSSGINPADTKLNIPASVSKPPPATTPPTPPAAPARTRPPARTPSMPKVAGMQQGTAAESGMGPPVPPAGTQGINPLQALIDLITRGPQAFMQDLQGISRQVGPDYIPPPPGPGAHPATPSQPPRHMDPTSPRDRAIAAVTPHDRTPQGREARAAEAERAVQAELAMSYAPVVSSPNSSLPRDVSSMSPGATPSISPTGGIVEYGGIPQLTASDVEFGGQHRPSMRPTQASVDRSVFNDEVAANRATIPDAQNLIEQAAWMVRGEVLANASIQAQRIQLETAFNRAQMRNTSLGHALIPSFKQGDPGYYDARRGLHHGTYRWGARPTQEQLEAFKRDVWDPVMAGSNYSDVGFGPMTGNASGSQARKQYGWGTQGYRVRAGGDTYFREGPFRQLPALPSPERQPAPDTVAESRQEGGPVQAGQPYMVGEQGPEMIVPQQSGQIVPNQSQGLPWQQWRQSENVEDTSNRSMDEEILQNYQAEQARINQPPQREIQPTYMGMQAGLGDIDQTMEGLVLQHLAREAAHQKWLRDQGLTRDGSPGG